MEKAAAEGYDKTQAEAVEPCASEAELVKAISVFPETVKARYIRYSGDGATDPQKNYCHISEIAVLGN